MINLLFVLIFIEMGIILSLTFATPARKISMIGLDRTKRGRGLVVSRTIAGIMLLIFSSSLYTLVKTRESVPDSIMSPTRQVLMANHLLEASLLGFSMFMGLMIDRLHYHIKDINNLRKRLDAMKQLK
ncbi:uncharacterized protein LOC124910613 [Impatiens glandulifera]|uniref:uncharacterized protein LOC124910613 n=1 Tax=Impatiens glandulifera TaxID=253017 RepID=UPI001FB06F59|nr:uncharacterized protein LOC124910613 [Impatiens glandulifera]